MTEDKHKERRRFSRVEFAADAVITQGEYRGQVHLVDISLKGVLVETPDEYHLKANQPASLSIKLNDDVIIDMEVHLVHSSHSILGLECTSIDMESIAHLRRLIELNLSTPDASERVLDELISHPAPA
ncbi:MAG: pilus assembly protein PilZ [Alteromonadaceae bacterium]|nr:MAG: pilus assembly protein PilZ [Alteromonadaceae bacterium]